MISKKSRKVVAALLIGATVCASGTFAYFNSKVDLSNVIADNAANKLNIKNGHVEIIGSINGQQTIDSGLWTYDVARLSTVDAIGVDAKFATAMSSAYSLSSTTTYNDILVQTGNYVNDNLSPDILGVGTVTTTAVQLSAAQTDVDNAQITVDNAKAAYATALAGTDDAAKTTALNNLTSAEATLTQKQNELKALKRSTRANIGEAVKGEILLARPGDAFTLGAANDANNKGIEITNKSNITTKIAIMPKGSSSLGTATDVAKAQLDYLANAGWKVYVKITRYDSTGTEVQKDGTAITSDSQKAQYKELTSENFTTLATAYAATDVKSGETVSINMRVELPLNTDNSMQDAVTGTGTTQKPFDITNLFDIVATQENNPGWNVSGSNTTPVSTTTANY